MSDVSRGPRADARRSVAAIIDAAVSVLGRDADASVEEVARAAGVSRQTVYAHFRSREGLVAAVLDHVTQQSLVAIEDAALDDGAAIDALVRFLDATWGVFEHTPSLPDLAAQVPDRAADDARHEPVTERLLRLVRRGQRSGEIDRQLSAPWLVTATVALGHAAGEAVTRGEIDGHEAATTLRRSVLRLYGVSDPPRRGDQGAGAAGAGPACDPGVRGAVSGAGRRERAR